MKKEMSQAVGQVPLLLRMVLLTQSGTVLCTIYSERSVLALKNLLVHNTYAKALPVVEFSYLEMRKNVVLKYFFRSFKVHFLVTTFV